MPGSSDGSMRTYLVELYAPGTDDAARDTEAARLAAETLTVEGSPVRWVRSIFVPEDETCLLLFSAATVESVRETALRAGLPFDRVSEAMDEYGR